MRSPWAWLLLQRRPGWSDTIAEVDMLTGRLVLPVPWWQVLRKWLRKDAEAQQPVTRLSP